MYVYNQQLYYIIHYNNNKTTNCEQPKNYQPALQAQGGVARRRWWQRSGELKFSGNLKFQYSPSFPGSLEIEGGRRVSSPHPEMERSVIDIWRNVLILLFGGEISL